MRNRKTPPPVFTSRSAEATRVSEEQLTKYFNAHGFINQNVNRLELFTFQKHLAGGKVLQIFNGGILINHRSTFDLILHDESVEALSPNSSLILRDAHNLTDLIVSIIKAQLKGCD